MSISLKIDYPVVNGVVVKKGILSLKGIFLNESNSITPENDKVGVLSFEYMTSLAGTQKQGNYYNVDDLNQQGSPVYYGCVESNGYTGFNPEGGPTGIWILNSNSGHDSENNGTVFLSTKVESQAVSLQSATVTRKYAMLFNSIVFPTNMTAGDRVIANSAGLRYASLESYVAAEIYNDVNDVPDGEWELCGGIPANTKALCIYFKIE